MLLKSKDVIEHLEFLAVQNSEKFADNNSSPIHYKRAPF